MIKTQQQKVEEVVEEFKDKSVRGFASGGFISNFDASDYYVNAVHIGIWLEDKLTSLLNQRDVEVIEMIEGMIEKDGECSCASYKEPLQDIIKAIEK